MVCILLGHAHRFIDRGKRQGGMPKAEMKSSEVQSGILDDVAAAAGFAGGIRSAPTDGIIKISV
jgi:hypothetical protein